MWNIYHIRFVPFKYETKSKAKITDFVDFKIFLNCTVYSKLLMSFIISGSVFSHATVCKPHSFYKWTRTYHCSQNKPQNKKEDLMFENFQTRNFICDWVATEHALPNSKNLVGLTIHV